MTSRVLKSLPSCQSITGIQRRIQYRISPPQNELPQNEFGKALYSRHCVTEECDKSSPVPMPIQLTFSVTLFCDTMSQLYTIQVMTVLVMTVLAFVMAKKGRFTQPKKVISHSSNGQERSFHTVLTHHGSPLNASICFLIPELKQKSSSNSQYSSALCRVKS